jgi:hypothetical protein
MTPLETLRAARDWQPFHTAPETGEVILVYRSDAGVFTAHYVEEDAHLSSVMNPPEGDFFWFSTSGEDLTDDLPTHWMHLPSPPVLFDAAIAELEGVAT